MRFCCISSFEVQGHAVLAVAAKARVNARPTLMLLSFYNTLTLERATRRRSHIILEVLSNYRHSLLGSMRDGNPGSTLEFWHSRGTPGCLQPHMRLPLPRPPPLKVRVGSTCRQSRPSCRTSSHWPCVASDCSHKRSRAISSKYQAPSQVLHEGITDIHYQDEVFHIPQAQKYCDSKWLEWDDKITTPPGLCVNPSSPPLGTLQPSLWRHQPC